jgi:hypothetical protein
MPRIDVFGLYDFRLGMRIVPDPVVEMNPTTAAVHEIEQDVIRGRSARSSRHPIA